MVEPDIRIKYDGGDANQNAISMRLLGSSLQGADKIISDGLIVLIEGRVPKRGERAPVIAKVREPLAGSYELWAFYQAVRELLALGLPTGADLAGYFIGEWWSAVIAKFSGKEELAEKVLQGLMETQRALLASREAGDARTHELLMAQNQALRETLAMQGRAIEQFCAPVGPSVDAATIYPVNAKQARLTTEDAEAIRQNLKMEWGPIQEETLQTDGFRFHTNGLSVANPDRDGWLMARVHDPLFKEEENVYTEAAQRRSSIVVLARYGYKGSDLAAIEILEFKHEITSRGD